MENFDIYNFKRRLELTIKRIEKSNMTENSKQLLKEFCDYCTAEGLALPTIVKHLFGLKLIAIWANKDLDKTDKKDMVKIIGMLEKSHYGIEIKHATKISLKKFYKWLNNEEEYPEKVKWIKSSKMSKKRLPEELFLKEEIERMIAAADHIRDKAIISLLYESGFRIGEFLNLRIKHIEFDKYGGKILVPHGKTGMRKIRVVSSIPHLATWIENHPLKEDPASLLWIGTGTRNKNRPIYYQNVNKLIKKIAIRARIRKRVNPHMFRHTRATHLANHFTEAQMNHYFGWVQGSKMSSIYVHLSGRDIDKAVLKLHGIQEEKDVKSEELELKKCCRCEKDNPSTGKFCLRCGLILDDTTAIEFEDKRMEMDTRMSQLMDSLLSDPEIRKIVIGKLEEIR